MAIILPVVSVACAAFCVWLMVRIVNRRERWAKRTLAATLIGLPAIYVASLGPACWLVARGDPDAQGWHPWFDAIYWPIARCATTGPEEGIAERIIVSYMTLALPKNSQVFIRDGLSIKQANGVRAYSGVGASNRYFGENQ